MSHPSWNHILIQTRFQRPPIPNDMVPRPRLTEWLDQHCQRPLILISAPAGYGKSTLISSWLEGLEVPSAWISVDESDNNLGSFLSYFIAAIQRMYPQKLLDTQALLQAPELPPMRYLSSILSNELNAIGENYFLVLDDYYLIQEITIHNLLDELLRFPPQGLHLVIGTRTDPLLSLVDLRARGQVAEIRGQDLRFSLDETKQLLHNLLGKEIEEGTILALEEKSEGWVTGLQLAALALRHRTGQLNIEGKLSANNRYVRDYLTSEILKSQMVTYSESLIKISILDRFCAGLCQAVCGTDDETEQSQFGAEQFMEWLFASNLFVILLDDNGQWVRFHHLFQEFLKEQLEDRFTQAEIASLHTRASTWFAQNGLINEAISHALHAGDPLGAALVLEQNTVRLLDEDRWHILEFGLAKLPDAVIQQRPQLLLAKAWVSFYHFALWAIPPILETIEVILEDEAVTQPFRGEVDFFWGHHWFWQGQNARALDLLQQAQERIPKTFHVARGHSELFWGVSTQMAGQKKEAVRGLNHWLEYEGSSHPIRQARLEGALIFIHLLSGELIEAVQMAQNFQATATKNNNTYARAWGSYLTGFIHYFRNDLEKALHSFIQAVDLRYILHTRAAIDSLVGLTLTYQALGQSEQANATIALLHEFTHDINVLAYLTLARSCQARLELLQGNMTAAVHWLQTAELISDADVMFYWIELSQITQCRVLIAQGTQASLQEAVKLLQVYRQQNEAQNNTRQLIDILMLQALAYQKQEQVDQAQAALEQAITLAEPGGWIRPFVESGTELVPLLTRQIDQKGATLYTSKLLAACGAEIEAVGSISTLPQSQLIDPLTNREFEILELLGKRLTNKEIASGLHISVGTVQQHLNHIYAKLNVRGRRQAITKAAEIDLLPFRK